MSSFVIKDVREDGDGVPTRSAGQIQKRRVKASQSVRPKFPTAPLGFWGALSPLASQKVNSLPTSELNRNTMRKPVVFAE